MLVPAALAVTLAAPLSDESTTLAPSDWQSIRAAHADARHAVESSGSTHSAFNHAQALRAHFAHGATRLERHDGDTLVAFELERWGRADALTAAGSEVAARAAGRRFEREFTGGLVEWWHNHDRGLEHGFTLATRPAGHGELIVELELTTEFAASVDDDALGASFRDANGAAVLTYSELVAFDRDGDRCAARLSLSGSTLRLAVDDRAADYPLTIDPIVEQPGLQLWYQGALDDFFGDAVALDGDTLAVGAPGDDSSATGVNGVMNDEGATSSGAVHVFVRNGTTWTQQAYLKASNTAAFDWFGGSIDISGDTIVVGARDEDSGATGVNGNALDNSAQNAGAAYVFVRNGTTWSQQAYLKASHVKFSDVFGASVAIDLDTIVVGAEGEDTFGFGVNPTPNGSASGSGAVFVFERQGTTWTQQAFIKASNTATSDAFGRRVSSSGSSFAVGANGKDANGTDSGATYVFARSGSTWVQQAYLTASNAGAGDWFGIEVDVKGERLVVSAIREDSLGSDAGAAYVFERSGSTWLQTALLLASNGEAGDQFGGSISQSGDLIVIQAGDEDSGSAGLDGDRSDDSVNAAGAVYVFERNGSAWSQSAYIKDTSPTPLGRFGSALALLGDTLVCSSNEGVTIFDLEAPPAPPSCIAPTPALELGAAPLVAFLGDLVSYPVIASSTSGECTIVDVSVQFASPLNGGGYGAFVNVALPPGATFAAPLPVTGAPAATQFSWIPGSNGQIGLWRFTHVLRDEYEQEVACAVDVEVRECLMLVGLIPTDVDLGTGDRLLVVPHFVFPILGNAVPHLHVPHEAALLGLDVFVQVGMWNPIVFPSNPLQMSNRLHYRIGLDVVNDGNGSGLVIAPDPGAVHPGGVLKVTLGMAPN